MRFSLCLLLTLAWALWFGGTAATFVFGVNLFHSHPDIAGPAANAMFLIFGQYELVLAAIALLAAGLLLINYPSMQVILLLAMLIISAGVSVTFALGLTPVMESLRAQGKTHSPEFMRLHGQSMIVMTLQAAALLLTGAALLPAIKKSLQKSLSPPRPAA